MREIRVRPCPPDALARLMRDGLHPVLARVCAARGIASAAQLETGLGGLLAFDRLEHVREAAAWLADAIAARKRLLIVADYDSDGATACAVGIRALREFGAQVDYLVPNRFEFGYGLTPEIVRLAAQRKPDILITVDNGIGAVEGVAEANRLGMQVLVTDHHLPGDTLPEARCIVNPNQPGCAFPSKSIAGVGVIFYLILALRAELRVRGAFEGKSPVPPFSKGGNKEPNLARLLDIVALGTVADVVRLDDNNRILVTQGLKRIREGRACAGIRALFQVAGRDPKRASVYDLGFVLGPRLNAAGRLDDMSLGIECLLAEDEDRALEMAARLDALNRERREIESGMQESALALLDDIQVQDGYSLSLFDPGWHQGVIGLLASRLKDRFHRPAIVFAPGNPGELKGSGRAIPGLNLRDALDLTARRHPGLLRKFGGHAAAAGLTIAEAQFERFAEAFEATVQTLLSPADLTRIIETDGSLNPQEITLETARALEDQVWGQGFPAPLFDGWFRVQSQRVVGDKHLKLRLESKGRPLDAMLFSHTEPLPSSIRAVYRLQVNEYNGIQRARLTLEHWEPS